MISERLLKRLRKHCPITTVDVRIPVDVLESLKAIASTRGLHSYKTLLKSYVSDGLRRDDAEVGLTGVRRRLKDTTGGSQARKNPHIGSSFDAFLKKEGIYEETQNTAIRRVLATHIAQLMKAKKLTNLQTARRLPASPAQLNRLLDPENAGVTLATLHRAAALVGRKLLVDLV